MNSNDIASENVTFNEALGRLRAVRDVVEDALDASEDEDERSSLRGRYDELAAEIRALHRKRLEQLVGQYEPLTQKIRQGVNRLDALKERIAELNSAVRTIDEALSIIGQALAILVRFAV